jgi:hypothetical protein
MAAVITTLFHSAVVDLWNSALAVIAFAAIQRWNVNSTWLIASGGPIGDVRWLLG